MLNSYSIEEIASCTHGRLIKNSIEKSVVEDVIIDSRRFVSGNSSLFVALVTKSNDGHKYISDLFLRGVSNYLVSKLPDIDIPEANFILVNDTLEALHNFSAFHRRKFHYTVIGVTGSNGKTIVKEWLFQLLSPYLRIVRSPKSFNSQIGVPLSVLQMTDNYNLGIFEAGISMPDEMDKLQKIISPEIGIFTNIGHAHDENFVDKRQKINEKIQLFKKCKTILYCHEHGEINQRILSAESFRDKEILSWSKKNKSADLYAESINDGKAYECFYKNRRFQIFPPFSDEASIENILHVVLVALKLEISDADISKGISMLTPIAMRLELKEGINNCSIINDVYNSDLNSITIAMDFLAQQNQNKKRTVIISDILQSGMNDYTLYSRIADMISAAGVSCVIGIGKAIERQQNLFKGQKYFYPTTEDFLRYHPDYYFSNESILIKGARIFEFERISNRLQQKAHQTVLEINLTAMIENMNFYRSKLKPYVKIMAMVKAFSYGSGSFEIANALKYYNIDYLAVAYADEGIELRKAGISLPIMVMNPDENAFDLMVANDLEPEIYSISILQKFCRTIENGAIAEDKTFGIHIKIDSGMHRSGFEKNDLPALINKLQIADYIKVKSVFSHLVGSDAAEFDDFTKEQVQYFSQSCGILEESLKISFIKHILNSAGICRFPDYQFDMVRLGIGLYGFGACPESMEKLRNVSSLKSIITQIKRIKKGESVGYNRSFIAENEIISATIPIGYADGFDRRFGNGVGSVLINGAYAPVIGNVCMDMVMVDVTEIKADEGDEVVIFNSEFRVSDIAKRIGTIPYEVLTSISRRVKRIYFQE